MVESWPMGWTWRCHLSSPGIALSAAGPRPSAAHPTWPSVCLYLRASSRLCPPLPLCESARCLLCPPARALRIPCLCTPSPAPICVARMRARSRADSVAIPRWLPPALILPPPSRGSVCRFTKSIERCQIMTQSPISRKSPGVEIPGHPSIPGHGLAGLRFELGRLQRATGK
jgi:hypothetical protein